MGEPCVKDDTGAAEDEEVAYEFDELGGPGHTADHRRLTTHTREPHKALPFLLFGAIRHDWRHRVPPIG